MSGAALARSKRLVRIVAVMLAIYAIIEMADCATVVLMHLGVIGNLYPHIAWPEFDELFSQQPIALLPVFLYFASLRGLSAWGLFRERVWGFWAAVLVCATTLLWIPFLMPLVGFEMLIDGTILILLFWARWGEAALFHTKDG